MRRAHATAAAAHSTTSLPLAPPHGTFAHVLRASAGDERRGERWACETYEIGQKYSGVDLIA